MQAIDKSFGSFDEFKSQFATAGATQFGSGWAWLNANKDGSLEIDKTPNAVCPLVEGTKLVWRQRSLRGALRIAVRWGVVLLLRITCACVHAYLFELSLLGVVHALCMVPTKLKCVCRQDGYPHNGCVGARLLPGLPECAAIVHRYLPQQAGVVGCCGQAV